MQRYLTESETAWYKVEFESRSISPSRCALEYEGEIDTNILRQAYNSLAIKYPALASEVRKRGKYYTLEKSENSTPVMTVISGDRATMYRESKIIARNEKKYMSQLLLVKDSTEARGYIVFQIAHMFVGGKQLFHYASTLIDIYTEIVQRGTSTVTPGSLPIPPTEMGIKDKEKSNFEMHDAQSTTSYATHLNHGTKWGLGCDAILTLSSEETDKIIRSARGKSTTVGCLLASAMAVALRASNFSIEPIDMKFQARIDWSRHIDSDKDVVRATMPVSEVILTVNLSYNKDIFEIAHEVNKKMKDATENGYDPRRFSMRNKRCSPSDIDISMNSQGVFPHIKQSEGLNITDFIILNMTKNGQAEATRDFLMQRKERPKAIISSYTFDGKLRVWIELREGLDEATVESFRKVLEDATAITE